MSFYLHPWAICESKNIGEGTRLWAFSRILPGAIIGRDCNICEGVFIENDVVVGDSVTIKSGVQLWDGITLEDHVFVGPNATFTKDPPPQSRRHMSSVLRTVVGKGASIGAKSTILPGITIGAGAMVGAGSVVTRNVPDQAIVVGNPAWISSYADTQKPSDKGLVGLEAANETSYRKTSKYLVELKQASDSRGSLVAGEIPKEVPFTPQRIFIIHRVPSNEARGAHAHKECHQFLICVSGSVRIVVDDGLQKHEFLLDSPTKGVYMPPMTWGTQYKYSSDAALLVLASHNYDPDDYIQSYEEFIETAGGHSE